METNKALAILGLQKTANQEQIKQAYRILSKEYHPDRNQDGLEMMKSINVAYGHLIKIKYDGKPEQQEVNDWLRSSNTYKNNSYTDLKYNKYGGYCINCNKWVDKGGGYIYKYKDKWKVIHIRCYFQAT